MDHSEIGVSSTLASHEVALTMTLLRDSGLSRDCTRFDCRNKSAVTRDRIALDKDRACATSSAARELVSFYARAA